MRPVWTAWARPASPREYVSPVRLSCAQELKRSVVASANASFDFMVFDFIDGEMSVARGKLGNGERILENWEIG
jgi:hypothetical protein